MRSAAPLLPNVPYPGVLADVRHGSHLCAFYETKDDLLDLVLPFFTGGSDRGELCVWMMPDHVSEHEANIRASDAIVESGLELYSGREFYLKRGRFDRNSVTRFWNETLQRALEGHRSGMHVSGDAFWLQQNDWNAFLEYEADLNTMVAGKPIAVLCTYPLSVSKSGDIFDVVRAHQVAIGKREHDWEVIAAQGMPLNKHAEAVEAAARILSLTMRERQVLAGVADGHSNKLIAHHLGINVRTVEAHRGRMLDRLGVRTIAAAVRLATLARLVTQTP